MIEKEKAAGRGLSEYTSKVKDHFWGTLFSWSFYFYFCNSHARADYVHIPHDDPMMNGGDRNED
ncbi:hypothetical protein [Paenibacillus sedimenti]|uniref:Uncharacterized protein n=1 Tax=Paenibacillus sedimenti TaxID=2770274 RepID=A0A926KJH8_9BACL|nr:hypothetical protein [Paenibacillus sedimenti]MBD0378902.1 hypothetical protein [Paenibacillus sedimenti]